MYVNMNVSFYCCMFMNLHRLEKHVRVSRGMLIMLRALTSYSGEQW